MRIKNTYLISRNEDWFYARFCRYFIIIIPNLIYLLIINFPSVAGSSPCQQNMLINHEIVPTLPPERDLIQFLDNVHIPDGIKNNSDSLHDLINLLPENMSLATVLMQPSTFHKQWFHYLLAKKGIEAAKKFEYLMMMSTRKERQNITDTTVRTMNLESLCADMLKTRINVRDSGRSQDFIYSDSPSENEVPYLEQQTPDLNWFDKPVNQINFDKPVYLKDPLHLDSFHQRSMVNASLQHDVSYTNSKSNLTNGISLCFDKRQSVPLYQRQSSLLYYQNQKGD